MFRNPQQREDATDTLENHSTDVDFSSNDSYSPTITIQPQLTGATRRAIPILTPWQHTTIPQLIPVSGLDILSTAEQLHIQQTVELNDLLANEASENRYTVKVPQGDTVYYASEQSSSCQRLCFGPSRSFTLKMYDQTQQEALELRRRLACGNCSLWCYLQAMEVWVPPNELVGTVEQKMNLNMPLFLVYNRMREPMYWIEGPAMCACLAFGKDAHFKIYNSDRTTQVGSINRQWDQIQLAYNLCVHFPGRSIDTKRKALLLGAAFLLEYMYFFKTTGCRCAC